MPDTLLANLPVVAIYLAGAQPQNFEADVEEVIVDSTHFAPSMAVVTLHDPGLKWTNGSDVAIGKALKIELGQDKSTDSSAVNAVVFDGEIVALEPEFDAGGNHMLTIRAFDKLHRALHGTQLRTFLQMTDSDILTKVVKECGLSAQVDSTSVTHEYVIQNNVSNMEFILDRAARNGLRLVTRPGKVHLLKATTTLDSEIEVALGENLRKFALRMSVANQATKFRVTGWDVKTKAKIEGQTLGTATNSWSTNGKNLAGANAYKSSFGEAEVVALSRVIDVVGDATALTAAMLLDAEGQFMEGEGTVLGEPKLLAGCKIKVTKTASMGASAAGPYDGTYYVTSATHILNREGYLTYFTVGGRLPERLLTNPASTGALPRSEAFSGVVVGLVTNVADPENMGRIKVKFPWMHMDIESDWIRIATPMAGATRGLLWLPEVDDEVLLAFEHGDPRRPLMVGALWNGKDKPPDTNANVHKAGKTEIRMFKTRVGHVLVFDDSAGQESILVQDKTGKNLIKIESATNKIHVESAADIELIAGTNITLDAKANITIKAGANISIEAGANLDGKANANATITANAVATLEGKAAVNVKGSMAEMSGDAVASVQGGIVMIN